MQRVLVPLDGSTLAEDALPIARQMAAQQPTEIVLCAVGELAETSSHAAEEREALMRILDHAAARLSGAKVRKEVRMSGGPADAIVEAANTFGVQRIVMGTHARSGLRGLGQDSVARSVMAHTTIPVTLVESSWDSRIAALEEALRAADCDDVRSAARELADLGQTYDLAELGSLWRCLDGVFNVGHRTDLAHTYLELARPDLRAHAAAGLMASSDEVLRDAGLDVASQLGPSALPELIRLTKSHPQDVQWIAYEAIRHIGGPDTIDPLVRGLENGSVGIRWVASNGLIEAGDAAILPVLRALVERPGSVGFHRAARRVLVRASLPEHEEALSRLLDSLGRGTTTAQSPAIAMEVLELLTVQTELR